METKPLEPGPQDQDRINVEVESDIAYWTRRLGVSRELLALAIAHVGPRAGDVARYLQRRAPPTAAGAAGPSRRQ